jgi:polyisoprenoid-binding protein YceI
MSVVENAREKLLSNGPWAVDSAHSTIEFRVRHMVIETVTGRFRDFDGTISSGDEPTISGSIRVASLDTLHEERDGHLRSSDFFDVERHPEIGFRASGIRSTSDDDRFALPGELTIKGLTRPISLDGEFHGAAFDLDGCERIAFALRGRLDRSDYGLAWNRRLETGKLLVGNSVELVLHIAAMRVD